MIEKVSFAGTTYAPPPTRFEAGTPHIAGVIGLETAIDYVNSVGKEQIAAVRGRPCSRTPTQPSPPSRVCA